MRVRRVRRPKVGDTVKVTVPAKVVMVGRVGYMAAVIRPEGFVYYKNSSSK